MLAHRDLTLRRCLASLAFGALGAITGAQDHAARGAIVERITPGGAAEAAGLQVGDVVLSWTRPPAPPANAAEERGAIESGFDLQEVEVEQGPRGPVTLAASRGGALLSVELAPRDWGLTSRPVMAESLLVLFERGQALVGSGDLDGGVQAWSEAAAEAARRGYASLACWISLKAAQALVDRRRPADAERTAEQALVHARALAPGAALARSWYLVGKAREARSDLHGADEAYREVARIREGLAPQSLALANAVHSLGTMAYFRGDFTAAEQAHLRALAMREALAPESLEVARSLLPLGNVALHGRSDTTAADAFYRRGLAIQERLAPLSVALGGTLGNLGSVARHRGDLGSAEEFYARALSIFREQHASDDVARALNNLAVVAQQRGDLVASEERLREALTLKEQIAPQSLDVASSLENLGNVLTLQGDADSAQELYQRAYDVREKLAPGSWLSAISLNNLGGVALKRGDLVTARDYRQRALAIRQQLNPRSVDTAESLSDLGVVAEAQQELDEARRLYEQARTLFAELAPRSLDQAEVLQHLGDVARARAELPATEGFYEQALSLRQQLAPGSADEAESLHALGLVRRASDPAAGAALLCRAVDAIESQKAKLGGSHEARSSFSLEYGTYYHDCLSALVDRGRPADAYQVLERSRARELLTLLAERGLMFGTEVPPELARDSSRIDAEYDRTQAQLAELDPERDKERAERALNRLRDLRASAREVAVRVRALSPRLGALRYPEPLDLPATRAMLDPGTVLLSYSVGVQRTYLFVVSAAGSGDTGQGLKVLTIPVGRAELQQRVESYRREIEAARTSPAAASRSIEQGRALFEDLVAPAEAQIEASARVLLCADGPLHVLPFAALVRHGSEAGMSRRPHYFVEWRPLHAVVSATVYAEVKKARAERDTRTLVAAFGDPAYPAPRTGQSAQSGDGALRSAQRHGLTLAPLPSTREEVGAISRLYAGHAAVYLGAKATEEQAKSLGKDVRYVHFACHGLLDTRQALNSALVLSIPERAGEGHDNGLLQAWEIFEKVRLDADLVTLSACDTALGKDMGGEGLLGLTRAFQFAGARSILASLWSVSDRSTAELMKRFYAYLKAGRAKDEALRAAQLDLIKAGERDAGALRAIGGVGPTRSPSRAALPFFWAAFELIGDWR